MSTEFTLVVPLVLNHSFVLNFVAAEAVEVSILLSINFFLHIPGTSEWTHQMHQTITALDRYVCAWRSAKGVPILFLYVKERKVWSSRL